MKKEFIEKALEDTNLIHGMISETNNHTKTNSKTLKNVSMTLKIENKRVQDHGTATGIAPLASEIEKVSKSMNQEISELINHHRPRLAECTSIIQKFILDITMNDSVPVRQLINLLEEYKDGGIDTLTTLEILDLIENTSTAEMNKLIYISKK